MDDDSLDRPMFDGTYQPYFFLDKNLVPTQFTGTLREFRERCEDAWSEKNLRVGATQIGPAWVSTVFLVTDHAFGGGEPVLYETMVFWDKDPKLADSDVAFEYEGEEFGPGDEFQQRYHTREQALEGHERVCRALRRATRLEEEGEGRVVEQ